MQSKFSVHLFARHFRRDLDAYRGFVRHGNKITNSMSPFLIRRSLDYFKANETWSSNLSTLADQVNSHRDSSISFGSTGPYALLSNITWWEISFFKFSFATNIYLRGKKQMSVCTRTHECFIRHKSRECFHLPYIPEEARNEKPSTLCTVVCAQPRLTSRSLPSWFWFNHLVL